MIITLTKDEVLKATQEYLTNNFTLSATIDVTKVVENYLADKVFNGTVPVNLSIEFKDDSSECILGDRDKFYQLVLNLIENAVKYSKEQDGYVKKE